MTTLDAHTLALAALVVFQALTIWAYASLRAQVRTLRASIPPDVTGDMAKLSEKVDDAHKRLTGISTSLKHTGETLRTAAARLGAN